MWKLISILNLLKDFSNTEISCWQLNTQLPPMVPRSKIGLWNIALCEFFSLVLFVLWYAFQKKWTLLESTMNKQAAIMSLDKIIELQNLKEAPSKSLLVSNWMKNLFFSLKYSSKHISSVEFSILDPTILLKTIGTFLEGKPFLKNKVK